MVALFAALIVPRFIDWNNYRTAFEAEAGAILGHPVRVKGSASASILPSPSLTFSDVEVDDPDGTELMTVKSFSATVELLPLLQGDIHVVSVTLEQPEVHVALDGTGNTDWFNRSEASRGLDPDKIDIEDLEVVGGRLDYSDARNGTAMTFDGVSATLDARSLLGPWHIEGSYLDQGVAVPFRVTTGLGQTDGSVRVQTSFSRPGLPYAISTDGAVNVAADGPEYRGTYTVTPVAATDKDTSNLSGLRSDGMFALTSTGVSLDGATFAYGPPDKATTVTGSVTWPFGKGAGFTAALQARQLDFDRALGASTGQSADIGKAAAQLVAALTSLPPPPMPGTLTFTVPAIVIGGSLVQDVSLGASAGAGGWSLDSFHARMPGQSTLDVSGKVAVGGTFGFTGNAHLAVAQTGPFAAWLFDRPQDPGRVLPALDLSGDIDLAATRFAIDNATAKIGAATVSGGAYWENKDGARTIGAKLTADSIDYDAIQPLAGLLGGANLTDVTGLADSFQVLVSTGSFSFQDFTFKDVAIDAGYNGDALTITRLGASFDGGSLTVNGRLDGVTSGPHGRIDGKLDATSLNVPVRFAQRVLPNSVFTSWLQVAAPALGPASLIASLTAPADNGANGLQLKLKGTAGGTAVDLTAVAHKPGDWLGGNAEISATFDSTTTAALARQAGLAAVTLPKDTAAHVQIMATGVPSAGLDATATFDAGGVKATAGGKLSLSAGFLPAFAGTVNLSSDNLDVAVALARLGIPGAAIGTSAKLAGDATWSSDGASFKWSNGTIAGDRVSGALTLAPAPDRTWRIGGSLDVDDMDLGWLTSLGLGFPPVPTKDPNAPWSKTPFVPPVYGAIVGKVAVTAARLRLSDQLGLRNTSFAVTLQPQELDVELSAGEIAGGTATGGFSLHNVAGNANLAGHFAIAHAALESFMWQLDGRAVATGTLDMSANFAGSGTTPAGLIGSTTGGGTLAVANGAARYIDPGAARTLVHASDLGQQYTDDALRQSFTQIIAGNSFKFDPAQAAFTVAAGTVRVSNLTLLTDGLTASVDATVDLNALSLDSDWTLTFDPGDATVPGASPRVGLVFRGPLAAPMRTIDVLAFSAYLNQRIQARMLDVVSLQDASRLEKDSLTRLTRRIGEEDAQRASDARDAADREARRKAASLSSLAAITKLHDTRQAATDKLVLTGLRTYADRATADALNAQRAADAARKAADAQKMVLDAAQMGLVRAQAAESAASMQADAATSGLVAAQAAADKANADLQTAMTAEPPTTLTLLAAAKVAADNATKALSDKTVADAAARIGYVNVQLMRVAAQAALDAATADTARLNAAAQKASLDSAAKTATAMAAQNAAAAALTGPAPPGAPGAAASPLARPG